jgi:FtsP/CotA-like multicopper oxidase with cupredoxin domain
MHVLNSSPTEIHWIALAGHSLQVLALDGNPVPSPRIVPMLQLAPAERASVLVLMDNPGVWVLGEVRRHVQQLGIWNYEQFAATQAATPSSDLPIVVPLVFEAKFRGHGAMEGWTINGQSYPTGVAPLTRGTRYRL